MGFVGPQFREAYSMLWWGLNVTLSQNHPGGASAVTAGERAIAQATRTWLCCIAYIEMNTSN